MPPLDAKTLPRLITAKDAARLLGVSPPTFTKIQSQYKIRKVKVGARYRYLKDDVLKVIELAKAGISASVKLNVFGSRTIKDIEVSEDILDLRMLDASSLDPYATISLLCDIIQRSLAQHKIHLLVDDSPTCAYLRSIGFFDELAARCGNNVVWDKETLTGIKYDKSKVLLPIKCIKMKGDQKFHVEKLLTLMKQQGFHIDVRSSLGTLLGELTDNAMTHSSQLIGDRICFFLIEKFTLNKRHSCIVFAIGDLGVGIHSSLKTNPKYKNLSDKKAFLEAFRPFVSSYPDEAKRGKGLTDLLTIAMGNHSFLRIDSSELCLHMDFRNEEVDDITWYQPITRASGTRFGMILIDKEFEAIERQQVDEVIKNRSSRDDNKPS